MNIHRPHPIASPADHRSKEVDEKMWEGLEDLDGIREDRRVVWEREKEEK